jgi:hypothetical protein
MTLVEERTSSQPRRRLARATEAAVCGLAYCASLLPLAIAAAALALSGRASSASRWWQALQRRGLAVHTPARPPTATATLGHAALSLLLGLAALVPLSMEALFLLRSVLYGLVDRGPYTDSWGGPTLLGAWAAHFLVGLPLAVAALIALRGIARLHERLTLAYLGQRSSRWPMLATLALALSAGLLFAAWLRQLPR